MRKRLGIIFLVSFFLNVLWEEAHAVLYISYQGSTITHFILLRAAAFDAAAITLLAAFLSPFLRGRSKEGVFVIVLIIFAVLLEKWALAEGRWVYADAMPIIPLLNVGLTPAIQLGLLGYLALMVSTAVRAERAQGI